MKLGVTDKKETAYSKTLFKALSALTKKGVKERFVVADLLANMLQTIDLGAQPEIADLVPPSN